MNKKKSTLPIIIFIFLSTFFTGCPLSIQIKDLKNQNMKISFSSQIGIEIYELLNSFDASTSSEQKQIFNSEEIQKDLLKNGYSNVNVQVTKPNSQTENLYVDFTINKEKISFLKNSNSSNNKTVLTLTPAILQELITNQNSIIQQYADLLMAPVFTNEQLSKTEYTDLLKSVYGEKIINEILKSKLTLTVLDSNNQKKSTSILLIDILTLTTELQIEL